MKIKVCTAVSCLLLLAGFTTSAMGQGVVLDVSDAAGSATEPVASGDPGDPVDIYISVTGDGSTLSPSWNVLYPTSEVSAVDASQCNVSDPDISSDTSIGCVAECSGGFTPPSGFDCISYISSPSNLVSPEPFATTVLGPITLTLAQTASIGSSFDIDFGQTDLVASTTTGTIQVNAPAGGFYTSEPVADGTLNLGAAPVNSTATPVDTLLVENLSADPFDVTGFPIPPAELTFPGTPVTVPGNGSFDFSGANAITCTPSAVGANSGTFDVSHDAAGGATSAVNYGFTCTGLAPNVQVAPTSVTLNGSIGGTPPTGSFTIENPDNETASDAQNASLTVTTDAGEITITDNIDDNVISVGETDTVTFSCSTAAAGGPFTETVQVAWDDPVGGGQATQDVTVTCNIANIAPGYTSDPAANTAGTEIDFTQVPFGSSSTETIAIGNEDSVGTGAQAELEVTGATLSDTTNYSIDPASPTFTLAADAANGTETIDVTCTPSGVGAVPDATLTVESNDGDQVYDLACEGDGELLSTSPSGGLNLGVVPPGTTTNEGTISFTNNGISGDITVENCSFSGPTDVFDSTPGVADFGFELQPGQSEIRRFQCTPPDISSFALDVSCDVTGGDNATLDFTVSCAGRPLVIPTMSRWGLVVMSLMLLLAGGFATRRMMA